MRDSQMKTEHPSKNTFLAKAGLLLRIDTTVCRIGDMRSENARFTQLFLYCSGGERSVNCVRPSLEMEASKEEQRGVVRLLVAEGAAKRHKVKTPWNAVGR